MRRWLVSNAQRQRRLINTQICENLVFEQRLARCLTEEWNCVLNCYTIGDYYMYVTSQQTITKPEFIWSRSFIVLWREANNVKAIKPYSKRVKLRFWPLHRQCIVDVLDFLILLPGSVRLTRAAKETRVRTWTTFRIRWPSTPTTWPIVQ